MSNEGLTCERLGEGLLGARRGAAFALGIVLLLLVRSLAGVRLGPGVTTGTGRVRIETRW